MSYTILPLNNATLDFSANYLGYINVFQLNKVTYVSGFVVSPLSGLVASDTNNIISFSPYVTTNTAYVSTNNTPQQWFEVNLYNERTTNLYGNFLFQGNIQNYTLSYNTGSQSYTFQTFITLFNSSFGVILNKTISISNTGNFSLSLDTTSASGGAYLHWGFRILGYPIYNNPTYINAAGSVQIQSFIYPCFKENTKILTFNTITNKEEYKVIQDIRKGTLVKTLLNNYVPVDMIGTKKIYNPGNSLFSANRLYKCTKDKYDELTEDLIMTGYHSILVEEITDEQREKIIEILGRIFITDDKYRLPICLDDKAIPYEEEGIFNIYHLALENDNYYMNYGIFANGLLVESTSKRYLKELSGMDLLE